MRGTREAATKERQWNESISARCRLGSTTDCPSPSVWTGGQYGTGRRISLRDTRALLAAALAGSLHAPGIAYELHPVFRLRIPKACPGVDPAFLSPRNTWADKAAYDSQAERLRDMFRENFDRQGYAALGIGPVM